ESVQSEREGRCEVDEIDRLVVPDIRGLMREQASVHSISARVREMGADERKLFNLKASLALADLTTLQESLRQYRDLIAGELRQHLSAQSAATAYAKSQLGAKTGRVS